MDSSKVLGHIALLNGDADEAERLYDLALSRIDGVKAKVEALNFMRDNDLELGKKSFPEASVVISRMETWVNTRIKDLK